MSIKTLFVDAHTFDENHQGIRTFIKGIYKAIQLDSSEIKVYLAAHNIDHLKAEFSNQPNFNFIALKSTNKYVRLAYEIPKLIKKHQFDYAHFNYYLPLFLSKRCKYIVTIHDVLFIDFPQFFPLKYRLINSYLFKRSALKANIITTVSNYSANRIKHNFNIETKPISVLPNAIDEKYTLSQDKLTDRNYLKKNYNLDRFIIYVSRIEPRKNHIKLVEAYRELKLWKEDIALVLIGKESFKDPKLAKIIELTNKESNNMIVRFDDVASVELIKFYNAAVLAVFPSLCEGFGIPPIESASLKTPTICSNSTAMKDFIFFKDHFFDATSKDAIKSMISKTLSDQNLIENSEKLNHIALSIKNEYSWNKTSQILKNLILNG